MNRSPLYFLRKQNTAIALFFLFLFSGCYTTQSVREIPSKNVLSGTEKFVSFSHYDHEIINTNAGNYEINCFQVNNYQGKKNVEVVKDKKLDSWKVFLANQPHSLGISILSAVKYDQNNNDDGAFAVWLISYIALIAPALIWEKNAPREKYVHSRKKSLVDYQEKQLLADANIELKYKNNTLTKKTDAYGQVKITKENLIKDLNIIHAESNEPIDLTVRINDTDTPRKLKIQASNFLNQYAKVKTPQTKIWKTRIQSKVEGIANFGSEYKINTNYNFKDVYRIELLGMKHGYISKNDVDIFYGSDRSNTKDIIEKYVEYRINDWQKQGEFESPENYSKRLESRNSKIEQLTKEAIEKYQAEFSDLIDWNKAEISRYDPNSETFKINIPNFQNIIIKVPIKNAEAFKKNWNEKEVKNQKFTLIDGKWELASLDFFIPELKYTAHYNNEVLLAYNPSNQFVFNFNDVNVNIDNYKSQKLPSSSTFDELNYNINSNLPHSEMQNSDGIAVVIGNSNYAKTDQVKYALNDAQLMKTYLTNVLGFKEGNIIFKMNATKADLEGIFGTNENHKGKLFNYVKEGASDVFIYYSGHGAPGINDKKGYLVPVDCEPRLVELQGYSLETLYNNLGKIPGKSTTMVIDACFSGTGILKDISSVSIKPKMPDFLIRNGVLLTSSSADEVASWIDSQRHGLFTYFFLKSIHDYKNTDENKDEKLTIKEIYQTISDKTNGIPYYARALNNGIDQHPELIGTEEDRTLVNFKKETD